MFMVIYAYVPMWLKLTKQFQVIVYGDKLEPVSWGFSAYIEQFNDLAYTEVFYNHRRDDVVVFCMYLLLVGAHISSLLFRFEERFSRNSIDFRLDFLQ
ncbi:MAG: hypothetical protein ACLURV_11295 [Gallintestinimicrobium sp.]